jgi:hypothetical protein
MACSSSKAKGLRDVRIRGTGRLEPSAHLQLPLIENACIASRALFTSVLVKRKTFQNKAMA